MHWESSSRESRSGTLRSCRANPSLWCNSAWALHRSHPGPGIVACEDLETRCDPARPHRSTLLSER
eukprot:scaffold574_cov333-Pavlova_lutheri.AAC.39